MRTLVLYESKVGSTKKYAEDIAAKADADVMPLKKFKWKNLKNYKVVVFGGWVKGGVINGLNDFLVHYDDMMELKQEIIVFSCGMGIPTPESRKELINNNILDLYHVRFYCLRGNFDMNKLGPINRMLIKYAVQQSVQGHEAEPEKMALLDVLQHPIVAYDGEKVDKIVSVIRQASIVEAEVVE